MRNRHECLDVIKARSVKLSGQEAVAVVVEVVVDEIAPVLRAIIEGMMVLAPKLVQVHSGIRRTD